MACRRFAFTKPTRLNYEDWRDIRDVVVLIGITCLLVWARVLLFNGPPTVGWIFGNVATAVPMFVAGGVCHSGLRRNGARRSHNARSRTAPE